MKIQDSKLLWPMGNHMGHKFSFAKALRKYGHINHNLDCYEFADFVERMELEGRDPNGII